MSSPTPRPPLWKVMHQACAPHSHPRLKTAAELRAIADWLVPEVPEPPLDVAPKTQINKCIDEHSDWREWFVTNCLRVELLAEADRAEAGND